MPTVDANLGSLWYRNHDYRTDVFFLEVFKDD